MFTYIMNLLLVGLALGMFLKGHYGITRQLAFGPLLVALLSATSAHLVDATLTPVLSAFTMALQVVIFAMGGLILWRDRTMARNKQARRHYRRELARSRAAFEQAAERRQSDRYSISRVA